MIEGLDWLLTVAGAAEDPEQRLVGLIGPQNLLITSPPGCGKTQALADRAVSLVKTGVIRPPQQILALSFSNRAKDNLRSRLHRSLGLRHRGRVTITNFHGMARRLVLAHGTSIGLSPEMIMPQRGWRSNALSQAGVNWRNKDRVERHLREAKANGQSDDEVVERLEEVGDHEALAFQALLLESNRLDYDDLLRHADRILVQAGISHLYKCRFPVVMVDEFQDLSLLHLRIATRLCGQGMTLAGDISQGIYAFAGAQPEAVLGEFLQMEPAEVSFGRSYRSSPRVLEAVNRLASEVGTEALVCARSEDWPDGGHLRFLSFDNRDEEAAALVDLVAELLRADPDTTVGILARRNATLASLRSALASSDLVYEDWEDAAHSAAVVTLLKRHIGRAIASATDAPEQLAALDGFCRADVPPEETEVLDDLIEALSQIEASIREGEQLAAWIARCRQVDRGTQSLAPGVHLLSGHKGKGQQFDWAVVVGVEEGKIPDFRAQDPASLEEERRVFHVMLSRARHGVVLTKVEREQIPNGSWKVQRRSRWWDVVADLME